MWLISLRLRNAESCSFPQKVFQICPWFNYTVQSLMKPVSQPVIKWHVKRSSCNGYLFLTKFVNVYINEKNLLYPKMVMACLGLHLPLIEDLEKIEKIISFKLNCTEARTI